MKRLFGIALIISVVLFIFSGCSPNKAWRKLNEPVECGQDISNCEMTNWEVHENFELAIIEFTERGNVFSNELENSVLKRLWDYSSNQNIAVIVFVHGWKHNANPYDTNVVSFRKALDDVARTRLLGSRKLIGLYIGWRGLSLHGLGLENLTYWDRKEVAQEVGKGGVTDILLELDKIDRSNTDNYLFIVGHSFGGAITLSALNEIFLQRINDAYNQEASLDGFGEVTVIINPAIEANQILQLKEASMLLGSKNDNQEKLLHIISSKGDSATHKTFPLGQTLGVGLQWSHEDLKRTFSGQEYSISEYELDVNTVGNYKLFHTHALLDLGKKTEDEKERIFKKFDIDPQTYNEKNKRWIQHSYCNDTEKNVRDKRLPCDNNEPLSFIYTTKAFIKDHNDVFNDNVKAYFATLVSEAIFKQDRQRYYPACSDGEEFYFEPCFNHHWSRFQ